MKLGVGVGVDLMIERCDDDGMDGWMDEVSYRFSSHGRRPSTGHGSSKSDDSFSLTAGEKEKSNLLSPILHAHDENDSSSFSSSGSHMEMASRDDQACELYLAKQDSDNEEYVQVNHSIRLLSSNPMKKA